MEAPSQSMIYFDILRHCSLELEPARPEATGRIQCSILRA